MKAEQRKELETNTLADKMGQAMRRVQTKPRRAFLIYFLVTVGLLVAFYLGFRVYRLFVPSPVEVSERWAKFYDASQSHLSEIKDLDTPAGKAARFQIAWIFYWDAGIRKIGSDADGALKSIKVAADFYKALAEECKDDPIFEPQALLGLAVIAETQAIQARTHLNKAEENYKKLAEHEKYKDTAQGKFAQDRLNHFKDEKKRAEMSNLYEELQRILRVPVPMQTNRPLDDFLGAPPAPPPADKPDKGPSK